VFLRRLTGKKVVNLSQNNYFVSHVGMFFVVGDKGGVYKSIKGRNSYFSEANFLVNDFCKIQIPKHKAQA
jgi:hypothetical protein